MSLGRTGFQKALLPTPCRRAIRVAPQPAHAACLAKPFRLQRRSVADVNLNAQVRATVGDVAAGGNSVDPIWAIADRDYERRRGAFYFRTEGIQFFCDEISGVDKEVEFCTLPHTLGAVLLFRFTDGSLVSTGRTMEMCANSSTGPDGEDTWRPVFLRSARRADYRRSDGQEIFRFTERRASGPSLSFCVTPSRRFIFGGESSDGTMSTQGLRRNVSFSVKDHLSRTLVARMLRENWACQPSYPRAYWLQELDCWKDVHGFVRSRLIPGIVELERLLWKPFGLSLSFSLSTCDTGALLFYQVGHYRVLHRCAAYSGPGKHHKLIPMTRAVGGSGRTTPMAASDIDAIDLVAALDYERGPERKLVGCFLFPQAVVRAELQCHEQHDARAQCEKYLLLVYPPSSQPTMRKTRKKKDEQQRWYIDLRAAACAATRLQKLRGILEEIEAVKRISTDLNISETPVAAGAAISR
ncbi:unnamed protein product [Amoebophrya sp. A120]|nr:unnamed protein product [Amoebophrya sp. A120]|eukprot:GSA120T00007726001.1